MLFVKVDDLRPGMRLGKPIYNKNGVLLHDRDTKLNMQAIYAIRNFGLLGLYILEPAEPLPPLTDDDIMFERFQAMAVFSIREDMGLICEGKKDKGMEWLCGLVMKNFASLDHRINFVQSLRSTDDFIYKHSMNVAILSALIGGHMDLPQGSMRNLIKAAVLHDIGVMEHPGIMNGDVLEQNQKEAIRNSTQEILNKSIDLDESIVRIVNHMQNLYCNEEQGFSDAMLANMEANILYIADSYDRMTAMKSHTEPTSEVKAIRELLSKGDQYEPSIVNALIKAINILYPSVCVELTNGEKGLVIRANEEDIFRPIVLGFRDNVLYDLAVTGEDIQIKDVMKTMDNRIKLDRELLAQYQEK